MVCAAVGRGSGAHSFWSVAGGLGLVRRCHQGFSGTCCCCCCCCRTQSASGGDSGLAGSSEPYSGEVRAGVGKQRTHTPAIARWAMRSACARVLAQQQVSKEWFLEEEEDEDHKDGGEDEDEDEATDPPLDAGDEKQTPVAQRQPASKRAKSAPAQPPRTPTAPTPPTVPTIQRHPKVVIESAPMLTPSPQKSGTMRAAATCV